MTRAHAIITAVIVTLCLGALPAVVQAGDAPTWRQAEEGALVVSRLVFARGVEDRQPVEQDFAPRADGRRIYAYLELLNKGEQRELTLSWVRAGKTFHTVTLDVGRSPHWRTWAYLTLSERLAGPWTVEVRGQDNALLAAMPLIVSK